MAKFIEFKRNDSVIKIDVNKVLAYEPSNNRAYPADEYTSILIGTGAIFVNEPFEAVDKKMTAFTGSFDPDKRL